MTLLAYFPIYFRKRIPGPYGNEPVPNPYDWYVDGDIAVSGDGTSLAGAFKTIAELLMVWGAGQSVWIEPKDDGSAYRELMVVPGNGCGIYSSGVLNYAGSSWSGGAVLSGADIAANASFSLTVGLTNTYEIAVTVGAGSTVFVNAWEDNVQLTRRTSTALVDANPGSYYVTAETGNITLYIHASDSSNITANGKVYEYTARDGGITDGISNYSNVTVQGIGTMRGQGDGGTCRLRGSGVVINNCYCRQGGSHTLNVGPGCTITNTLIEDGYRGTTSPTMVNINAAVYAGETVTITDCVLRASSATVAGWAILSGCNGHRNTSGDLGLVQFTRVKFENLAICCSGINHTNQVDYIDCIWTNCKGSATTAPGDGPSGTFACNVTGGTWTGRTDGSDVVVGVGIGAYTITNWTFIQNVLIGGFGYIRVTGAATLVLTDSSFAANASGNRVVVYCDQAGANLTMLRNVYNAGAFGWTQTYLFTAGASGMTWVSDFNTFYSSFTASIFGTAYTVLATYQAAVTPNDANST